MIIGISGYMGSGKTTISTTLSQKFGVLRLCGDSLAKTLMRESCEVIDAVASIFPVVESGGIDFKKLAGIVFSSSEKMSQLNSCVHPFLMEEILKLSQDRDVLLDAAPLPLWTNMLPLKGALWIDVDMVTRTARVQQREGYSQAEALSRIEGQMRSLKMPDFSDSLWSFADNSHSLDISLDPIETWFEKMLQDG